MYDYIKCEYPLPDGFDVARLPTTFQTKSFGDPYMETYTITADGRLLNPDGSLHEHTLEVNFYASNWGSFGPHRDGVNYMTTSGDAPWLGKDYTATFVKGHLLEIVGGDYTPKGYTHVDRNGKVLAVYPEAKEVAP